MWSGSTSKKDGSSLQPVHGEGLRLIPCDLENQFSLPGVGVEIYEDDLLPCAKGETSICERHVEGGTKKGGSDMRMAIIVNDIVAIRMPGRKETLPRIAEVRDDARLILHGCHPGGRAWDKERDDPLPN